MSDQLPDDAAPAMLIAIALLLSYSIALIVAGHGAVPVGLLLVMGGWESWWAAGKAVGWTGIAGVVAATFLLRKDASRQRLGQFLASVLLYLSWWLTAYAGARESGSLWSSLVFSAPFQTTFFVVACRVLRPGRSPAGSGSTH